MYAGGEKLLLNKRTFDGKISLLGGKEDPEDSGDSKVTLCREILEETGVDIRGYISRLVLIGDGFEDKSVGNDGIEIITRPVWFTLGGANNLIDKILSHGYRNGKDVPAPMTQSELYDGDHEFVISRQTFLERVTACIASVSHVSKIV